MFFFFFSFFLVLLSSRRAYFSAFILLATRFLPPLSSSLRVFFPFILFATRFSSPLSPTNFVPNLSFFVFFLFFLRLRLRLRLRFRFPFGISLFVSAMHGGWEMPLRIPLSCRGAVLVVLCAPPPFPVRHFPSFVSAKIGGWEMPLRIPFSCRGCPRCSVCATSVGASPSPPLSSSFLLSSSFRPLPLPCGEGWGGVILPPLWGEELCSIERPVDGRRTNTGWGYFFSNLFAYIKYFLYLCIVKNINISSIIYIVYNTNVLNSKN